MNLFTALDAFQFRLAIGRHILAHGELDWEVYLVIFSFSGLQLIFMDTFFDVQTLLH